MAASVIQEVEGNEITEGAGVKLVRVLSKDNTKDFDPFLLLDSFDSTDPEDYIKGFPMHPHRGLETLTYLIEGQMTHEDSLGNSGKITAGSAQWMTAGSGIEHQEMPEESDRLLGIQLWINLPREEKMTRPKYFDVRSDDIESVKFDGGIARVLSGEFMGARGVKPNHIQISFYDISLEENKSINIPKKPGENSFIFLIQDQGQIGDKTYNEKSALLLDDSDQVEIRAVNGANRFLFIEGKPCNDEIAWAGPIVMNSPKEIQQAYIDMRNKEFIKEDAIR